MCRQTEEIFGLSMTREEAVRVPGWLEALHDMLASSGALMTAPVG